MKKPVTIGPVGSSIIMFVFAYGVVCVARDTTHLIKNMIKHRREKKKAELIGFAVNTAKSRDTGAL